MAVMHGGSCMIDFHTICASNNPALVASPLICTSNLKCFSFIGLIMSYLPDIYLEGLKKRLVSALTSPPLSQWNLPQNPFDVFSFNDVHSTSGSTSSSRYLKLPCVPIWCSTMYTGPLLGYDLLDGHIKILLANFKVSASLSKKVLIFFF